MAMTMEQELLRRLAHAIAPELAIERCSGQKAIDDDDGLVGRAAGLPAGSSVLRIWENHNCLVTTRAVARRRQFAVAAAASKRSGWPVHVRTSGGSTVIHRPGILNISLAVAAGKGSIQPAASYAPLIALLQPAFRKLHIEPEWGSVAGAYCDGTYNLCLKDRKVAGTASRILRRQGQTVYLCHASITVYGSTDSDISSIRAFEQQVGLDHVYRPSSHTTVANMIGENRANS